jgi:DNA-binding SARP family transcriptional activator
MRIELFGGFRVTVDGRVVPDAEWARRKPAALIKLLALAPGRRLRREQVMDILWPELDPAAAAANLRKALHSARRALSAADGADRIVSVGDLLCLSSDQVSIDVEDYWVLATTARRTRDADCYLRAIELYQDGLLAEDVYEDWAAAPREELRADWTALAIDFAEMLEAQGDLNHAARVVQRVVAAEPLREENHGWLMRLHALAGRRDEARRVYERLRELLDAELGVEPSAQVQRLYEEIRGDFASEPELASELWERVGDLRAQSGDAEAAGKAFEQALEAASDSATASRLHRKCATALLMGHRPEAAMPHVDAADALAPDVAEQGRIACLRANVMWEVGDLDAARRWAERAHQIALAEGTADDVTDALQALAIISHLRGDWRSGLQALLERLSSEDLGGRIGRFYEINHCISQYQLYDDELAGDVEDYARQTLAVAERRDAIPAQAFAWCLLGESLMLHGHWDEAAGCLERSCELYGPAGSRTVALPWLRRAELAVCVGAHEDVAGYLRRATAIAAVTPMARHAWGRLHATAALAALELERLDHAVRSVRAARNTAARYGDCPTCSAMLNPLAADALTQAGDRREARVFARAASDAAASFPSSAFQAMAESAAGSVALGEGDTTQARTRFETAAALYDKAQQPFWVDRSLRKAAGV